MSADDRLYPTQAHRQASLAVVDFFSREGAVKSVLLTCSCARGKASPDSCLDIAVFTDPRADPAHLADLQNRWDAQYHRLPVFQTLRDAGRYSQVDLEMTDGIIVERPEEHNWTSGPDSFELSVGNLFVYGVPLFGEEYWASLKAPWMPYYDEALRGRRLSMVVKYLTNNLEHIPPYLGRGLYFQCHKRLLHAFEEFLQALFISRKVYPVAYDKHIREQVVDILKLPELYARLAGVFEIARFESREMLAKKELLEGLIREYVA